MSAYGYARVSTTDQDLAIQIAALQAAGCTVIREEKKSATSRKGRTELDTLLDSFVRATPWSSPASTAWPGRWVTSKTSCGL